MTIRVIAVGCGWVTTQRHIPAIRRTPDLRLVGVVDRRRERAERVARDLRVSAAADLRDPALPEHDAVSIGTYPPAHEELALGAIAAGKHVIVEKPLAMDPAAARRIADAARQQNVVCAVIHNFQFARSVARAKAIVASGRDGGVRGVLGLQLSNERRRLPEWYRELPGGLFYDEAPHLFYLARIFLGEIAVSGAHVSAPLAGTDPTPRNVTAHLDGARAGGTLHFEFGAALSEWQLVVLLERATLFCDVFRDILVRVTDDGRHTPRTIMATSVRTTASHWAGVASSGARFVARRLDYGNAEVFRRFAAAIHSGARPDAIDVQDGVAVIDAMHATLAAQRRATEAISST